MENMAKRSSGHIKARQVVFTFAITLLAMGCATPKQRSALEVYDARGSRLAKPTDTYEFTRVYPFQYNDVFDAVYKVLFRNGFQIEREDRNNGILQGSVLRPHIFSGGSRPVPFTASVVVKEINSAPRTEIRMVLDTHCGVFSDSLTVMTEPPSQKYGPALAAEIQKVLSTFE